MLQPPIDSLYLPLIHGNRKKPDFRETHVSKHWRYRELYHFCFDILGYITSLVSDRIYVCIYITKLEIEVSYFHI